MQLPTIKLVKILFIITLISCSQENQDLREQLLQMEVSDQAIRNLAASKSASGEKIDSVISVKWDSIDSSNTSRIKKIIKKYGWPNKTMVGEDGAKAAFLLVQHADKEPKFQKKVLPLLAEAVKNGLANPIHLAYLTDRVKVKEKLPQIYGTQINWETGSPVPYPIEDSINVDKRRLEIGLDSLYKYVAKF